MQKVWETRMSVKTFDLNKDVSVTVTEAAAEHFRKQIEKTHSQAIRLSMKESGCTGFRYVIEETENQKGSDIEQQLGNGVRLFIDPSFVGSFQGTVIDFKQEGLNQNLVIENPNVKDECGCGESVSFN
jgi:Fe-S cluster assembly protein SufA